MTLASDEFRRYTDKIMEKIGVEPGDTFINTDDPKISYIYKGSGLIFRNVNHGVQAEKPKHLVHLFEYQEEGKLRKEYSFIILDFYDGLTRALRGNKNIYLSYEGMKYKALTVKYGESRSISFKIKEENGNVLDILPINEIALDKNIDFYEKV